MVMPPVLEREMVETKEQAEKRIWLSEAQAEYCKAIGAPRFAPLNGLCWSCGKDATHEGWRTSLQTGCKHCHRSWCE